MKRSLSASAQILNQAKQIGRLRFPHERERVTSPVPV